MFMKYSDVQKQHFDVWLLFTVIVLVGCGITMVYSSSAVFALEKFSDSYFFLKRSALFAGIGFVLMMCMLSFCYHRLKAFAYPALLLALGLVILVLVPGVGKTIGGATRWLSLGVVNFQPSEFAKIALILFLAYSLEKKTNRIRSFTLGIIPHFVVMTVVSGTILYQKDFGSAAIIAAITWFMLFAAGARKRYLFGIVFLLAPIAFKLVAGTPYRRRRIMAFLNPWDDQYGSGFQMIQSFVAFNEGGWFGKGLGQGQQKLFYLPEAHTDFIFSVIGEELGLVGVFAV
ncbi:MAG: stage V sporulation protein E, partial [Deltaproteobacteria bacterium CG_4_10_14_0_2_um_filter_43_8]